MPKKNKVNASTTVTTVLIGGAAGDGAKEATLSLAKLINSVGLQMFASFEYPSLIRGGHNFCRLSFSADQVYNDHTELDVIVALNAETAKLHQKELKRGGIIFSEENLPMARWTKEENAPAIAKTAVALGAVCRYFNLPFDNLEKIFIETFGKKGKAEINIKLAKKGYDYIKDTKYKILNTKYNHQSQLTDGNQACADGMLAAGLDAYFAYPMTPASSILHYLAHRSGNHPVRVVQPENEIAVANMALGAAMAGKRTAVGTSGGGFALMEESISLAGIAETPLVIALSQRPGPATGVPTGTAQADLILARSAGHGEFPRIVLAPGDAVESYELGALSLNLSWKYQTPAIILLDKHLSESVVGADLSKIKIKTDNGKVYAGEGVNYRRYQMAADGVSPLAFFGAKDAVIKYNSYEHDERGLSTEELDMIVKMTDKRMRKIKGIEKELKKYDMVKVFGDKRASTAVLFWGSTKGAVLEALKYIKKPIRAVQVIGMEPFPVVEIKNALKGSKKIIAVETNVTGMLAQVVTEKCGIKIARKILRYDGRPIVVEELAKQLTTNN